MDEPTHGYLTGTAPNLTYHPNTSYFGTDFLTFKVSDGDRESEVAQVTLDIRNSNVPQAFGDVVTVCRGETKAIALRGDPICGSTLTYTIVSPPTHGDYGGTPPNVTYTPDSDYEGPDSFTFKVNNGLADSAVATISITVGGAPYVGPMDFNTDVTRTETITLSGYDNCEDSLTFTTSAGPTLGSFSGTAPHLTYHPVTPGRDSFLYRAFYGVQYSD